MLASLTKFSCVFDKLPNTINKRHFSSNKVVPWPRSFCLGVGFMASYFPHEILSKRSTVDSQNLKLRRGTRQLLGVFSYPSVWTWGIPHHPKMACPSCSPCFVAKIDFIIFIQFSSILHKMSHLRQSLMGNPVLGLLFGTTLAISSKKATCFILSKKN